MFHNECGLSATVLPCESGKLFWNSDELATIPSNEFRLEDFRSDSSWRVTMKKFLLGTVGLVALGMAAGPASAADLAARPVYTKAPPPMVAAAYDWSGFYIGINGGWGETHDNRWDVTRNLGLGSFDANGGTIGGQLGYRWQTGAWVFGLEAQGNWADFSGSTLDLAPPLGFPNVSLRSRLDAFGLFTGQVGY